MASSALVALVVAVVPTVVLGQGRERSFAAALSGFQETPTISSNGQGHFTASIDDRTSTINYRLTYSGLGTDATVAHIHLGARAIMGSVAAFLCGGGGKPACPPAGSTVTGTIVASDVVAIPAQGLGAGDFAALVRAVRAGATYANVHTTQFPAGEIRGQIGTEVDIRQDEQAMNN